MKSDSGSILLLVFIFFLLIIGLWLKIRRKVTVRARKKMAQPTETHLSQNNETVKSIDEISKTKAFVSREKYLKAPKGYWPLGEPR
jgi:cytoskeletal protein RodZ